jgi:hypothetical protein
MATFSKKMMGKEVGQASVYAKPHTMSGKPVKATTNPGKEPNNSNLNVACMNVGSVSNKPDGYPTKTSGIKIRGTGAATKGTMARGPMA